MTPSKRKRLFVDSKVQGVLMLRAALYWGFSLLTISLFLLVWRILTGPARLFHTHFDDMWFHYGPAFVASLLLLPVVLTDVARLSNRFCGPMARLRNALWTLGRGGLVTPLRFREGDYWQEFAREFNAVQARIEALEHELALARGQTQADADAPLSRAEG